MKTKLAIISLVITGLLAVYVPAFAHHGAAVYDTTKTVEVKGTVTDFLFRNPHIFLKLDAKDESGNAVHWTIEGQSPVAVGDSGWNKSTFKPGDEVALDVTPYKNQSATFPIGRFACGTCGKDTKGHIEINGQVFKP